MATLELVSPKSKFPLGRTVITENALTWLDPDAIQDGLRRHASGDWGKVCPQDARSNASALKRGGRLISVYGQDGRRFWIITEADRSVTTVLMPLDY